jgi:hypothetical protein
VPFRAAKKYQKEPKMPKKQDVIQQIASMENSTRRQKMGKNRDMTRLELRLELGWEASIEKRGAAACPP